MRIRRRKVVGTDSRGGSALILAVVLTSLLAMVGVLFVMSSRVDKLATVAISDNRELNLAVETIVAKLSEELVLDLPHSDASRAMQEYYDYPDANNIWLASLEPILVPPDRYEWLHISDVYGRLDTDAWNLLADTVPDYQAPDDMAERLVADADADGVLDSMWVRLDDMTSSKGKPIFGAIRVIDTGGMLNVNTGFKFDPNQAKGSSLMEINLMALARQFNEPPPTVDYEDDLLEARSNYGLGIDPLDLGGYERNVVWRYYNPNGIYTPFDIADELELRYRFLINQDETASRLEELGRAAGRRWGFREAASRTPIDSSKFDDWCVSAYADMGLDPNYAYRHIATTYNIDRIIEPNGTRMVNVNKDKYNVDLIFSKMWKNPAKPMDTGVTDNPVLAAQMAVNIKDYLDEDSVVTAYGGQYGFESPCVYISELAYNASAAQDGNDIDHMSYAVELYRHPNDVNRAINWDLWIDGYSDTHGTVDISWPSGGQYYVVRWQDPCVPLGVISREPNAAYPPDGALGIDPNVVLIWPEVSGANSYNVYLGTSFADVNAGAGTFQVNADSNSYDPNGLGPLDSGTKYYWRIESLDVGGTVIDTGEVWKFTTCPSGSDCDEVQDIIAGGGKWTYGERVFGAGDKIELRRRVPAVPPAVPVDVNVVVDSIGVPLWLVGSYEAKSFKRDINLHKCIRRLWDKSGSRDSVLTLGISNRFEHADKRLIQAHPADANFINIGEIGTVFSRGAYYEEGGDPIALGTIGYSFDANSEAQVRIDVNKPIFQPVFNYLTVFDPSRDGINNDGDGLLDEDQIGLGMTPELKIAGRININTAPWYVIAQLPWISAHTANFELARAIAAYRDSNGGFKSIGELMNVPEMAYYEKIEVGDQKGLPDLTAGDDAPDDYEERDLIFARISNLISVRSDVFTAYILVRLGHDGPQKRYMAILDRSNVYYDPVEEGPVGEVRIVALHPVPDPR